MTYRIQVTARQEVRRGSAGPVRVDLDRTVAAATYRVLDPDGGVRLATTSATLTQVGIPARTQLTCAVPTDLPLAEGYELEVTAEGVVEHLPFDVVLRTLPRSPSLDDILQVRGLSRELLEAQAARLGVSVEHYAERVLADLARGSLRDLLRAQLAQLRPPSATRWVRPWAILDADDLHRAEVRLAVAWMYEHRMQSPQDDASRALRDEYRAEARAIMSASPMRLDIDGDGLADRADRISEASVSIRRVQG